MYTNNYILPQDSHTSGSIYFRFLHFTRSFDTLYGKKIFQLFSKDYFRFTERYAALVWKKIKKKIFRFRRDKYLPVYGVSTTWETIIIIPTTGLPSISRLSFSDFHWFVEHGKCVGGRSNIVVFMRRSTQNSIECILYPRLRFFFFLYLTTLGNVFFWVNWRESILNTRIS